MEFFEYLVNTFGYNEAIMFNEISYETAIAAVQKIINSGLFDK